MKNEVKKSRQQFFKLLFLCMLMVPVTIGVSAKPVEPVWRGGFESPSPTMINQSQGAISFAWNAVSGANAYQVYYVKKENEYISSLTTTGSPGISYSGLPAGTYTFFFRSVFGEDKSDYVIQSELIIM